MAQASSKKGELAVPEQSISLNSPAEMMSFAKTLKEFIIREKLFTQIKKNNYAHVEAWQFMGAVTNVVPVVTKLEDLSADKEIKYRAEVALRQVANDAVVGYGIAVCSDKEANRKGSEEYVIASMAQTRATGKAYRNGFGWLMKIAGYEATPAEEMPSGKVVVEVKPASKEKVKEAQERAKEIAKELRENKDDSKS